MASADDIVAYARAQLGKPYVFGAEGPDRFDCSGLVQYVYGHFGVRLPRTSTAQARVGTPVAYSQIQAGDLVFSRWNDEPANGHVGIAVGPHTIINAPHTGANVRLQELTPGYMAHVTAVRRVGDITGAAVDASTAAARAAANAGSNNGLLGPIVQPLVDIASAAKSGATVADALMKVFIPNNAVRLASGIAGAVLIVAGVILLSREVRT